MFAACPKFVPSSLSCIIEAVWVDVKLVAILQEELKYWNESQAIASFQAISQLQHATSDEKRIWIRH